MKEIADVLGDFPVLSETFVGNEICAMARRGHEILRPGRRSAGALRTLPKQNRLPRKSLMWNAMTIAAIAREEGSRLFEAAGEPA